MRIIVEGWRFLCHSYSVVNQFQMMEMLKRPDLELFHRDMPYIDENWKTEVSDRDRTTQALRNIPHPAPNQPADVTLRMYCPWNFTNSNSSQTWVFAATEWGTVTNNVLDGIGVSSLTETPVNSEAKIITCSQWSKAGLIHSGVQSNRITVVPLGVDTDIYHPLTNEQRTALRQAFGWQDSFIFLNIGGCTDRKGIRPLLKAFAAVIERYPHAKLVLKGSELLYPSKDDIAQASRAVLSDAEREKVAARVIYTGTQLSFSQVAQLYQAADAYVSPYLAEGFNLPVLEAAACGLPVICTQGGPTDDFTHPDFALQIESKFTHRTIDGENFSILAPNLEHLTALMQATAEKPEIAARARQFGPSFVADRFTWKHAIDHLLHVFLTSETRAKINRPAFEPIIL
ncbi:glycosyltransferase family 4 protein [Kamptonema sp. UHCC 0994]|uniref:glycosyltransferase family 4 protein n=1 Tax=Kamptonema sp. UHCC 0994 TaxID=3031329 RepID=UPI0023BACBE0|nr:glycosyltransferase family 4 protein [Kamptonema sp. UHCC 0994]MDF0557085.1 glycosyltransferase family 4 protein [Kamptonema sp. UHCC 0994]